MLLASSGRNNFEELSIAPEILSEANPHDLNLCTSRASMCAMLTLEAKLRNSTSVQRLLGDHESDGEEIYLGLQHEVASKFQFINPKFGVAAIRAAASLFPNDTELLHLASYRKYNRSGPCTLSIGDQFPDLPLYALEKENEETFNNGDAKADQSSLPTLAPISKHHRRLLNVSNNIPTNKPNDAS